MVYKSSQVDFNLRRAYDKIKITHVADLGEKTWKDRKFWGNFIRKFLRSSVNIFNFIKSFLLDLHVIFRVLHMCLKKLSKLFLS